MSFSLYYYKREDVDQSGLTQKAMNIRNDRQLKPERRTRGKAVMAAYRADNPETLYEATMRKSQEFASRLPFRFQVVDDTLRPCGPPMGRTSPK